MEEFIEKIAQQSLQNLEAVRQKKNEHKGNGEYACLLSLEHKLLDVYQVANSYLHDMLFKQLREERNK